MLRYILAVLFLLTCFAQPAAAQTTPVFVKNEGKVHSPAGEPLYLIRLAEKMIMPGHVHYVLIDEQARIVARSPGLNQYAHSLECPDRRNCLVYDLWDINPEHHAVWNMMHDLRPAARQNIIDARADDAQKKAQQDLMTFIKSGSSNIFETLLLQNAPPFGIASLYGEWTSITKGPIALHTFIIISLFIFSVIIFHQNIFYFKSGDTEYASHLPGGRGLNTIHLFALAAALVLMWTIPVWHFAFIVSVYIILLYYAYKRASRIAAQKTAAKLVTNTGNP